MTQTPLDSQQENRRLRSAAEAMRSNQRLAQGGLVIGFVLAGVRFQIGGRIPDAIQIAMLVAAALIVVVTAIPFSRSLCPKCKGKYHSVAGIFRSSNSEARPCKSCGFNIDKHIPRYG
jgi:hypothetical protein